MKITFRLGIISIGILCILFAASGCSYIINATAESAAKAQIKRFNLHVNRVKPFARCLDTPGGACQSEEEFGDALVKSSYFAQDKSAMTTQVPAALSTYSEFTVDQKYKIIDASDGSIAGVMTANTIAADLAREALNDKVQEQLNGIYSVLKGSVPDSVINDSGDAIFELEKDSPNATLVKIDISLKQFQDYQDKIEAATLLGGWDALNSEADLFDQSISNELRSQRAYIAHYFKAYFRDGKFFKAEIDGSKLKKKIIEKLKDKIPGLDDSTYDELATKLFPEYKDSFDSGTSKYIFGKIGDTGFVTRGGQSIQFPGITASSTLGSSDVSFTKVDYIAVGSDLIRVLLHAIYDSDMQIPAVSNGSGLSVGSSPLMPNIPEQTNVDAEEFGNIETRSAQIEGVISAGTGRLIRGASFLSLNNEALATAIETAIGLAVRKQTEKVMWCWYACKFNELGDAEDYMANTYGDLVTLEISVSGLTSASSIEGTAKPGAGK